MSFYLGGPIDTEGKRVPGETALYDPSDLTADGVIVGMTGSGKTGLGIIYLEEALRSGIPCLIIDPEGDMTNLLLTFPDLAPSDFEPWIDTSHAEREGRTASQEAADEAAKWTKGLGWWNLSGNDIGDLTSRVGMTIYTPGSKAGVPVNGVGGLHPPDLSWDDDAEAIRDEIQGFASGLTGLVDIDAGPISSREHILITNLIEHAWRTGIPIDIGALISQIMTPPIRTLGVFDIDDFFPEKARTVLAMKLNGLLASQAIEDRRNEDLIGFGFYLLTGPKPGRRSRGTGGRDRLRRAETKIETKRNAYEDLNIDLEDAIDRIDDKATRIEEVSIGPEADDIEVSEVRLVWIRVQTE